MTAPRARVAAYGEEGPSRRVGDIRLPACDAGGAGLQEVDFVHGRAVYAAGEDGEELEDDAAGEDDDAGEAEEGAGGRHGCFCVMRMLWRVARHTRAP